MDRVCLGDLLANAGLELASLAERGHGLQPLMERAIVSATAEKDITAAQDLDKLVQALEELSGFMERLSLSVASEVEVNVGVLREGLLLGELQRRLFARESHLELASAAGELDLF
jgi:hypothetical protein